MPEPFSATAPLKSVPGSAAAPGITVSGDTDTGLYSPGPNQLAVTVGGSDAAKFSSTGLELDGDINLDDGGTFTTTIQTVTPTANRTISFPNATGTVALVAGSSGQLLYNASGANAGLSTVITDGNNITLGGRVISGLNGAASAPPGAFVGTWFTGGTSTTTKPQVVIEPTGTTSTSWSTSGTGFGVNAASGFAGNLLDLQLNGTSNFNVDSTGRVSFPLGAVGTPSLYPGADTNTGFWSPAADTLAASTNGTEALRIRNDQTFCFFSNTGTSGAGIRAIIQATTSRGIVSGEYVFQGGWGGSAGSVGTVTSQIGTDGDIQNTNNSYGAISDIKLKENIVDASSQWADLKALQVRNYNFKEGQTHTQIGLVAQEVELVSPGLVRESLDRDGEGNDLGTTTKSVNYSVLYMKAVKALQEAMERIEALEAKVAALEGA